MKKSVKKFSIKRFLKIISTDILSNAQSILLAAGSLCAVLIFILCFYASIDEANHYWPGIYSAVFFITGLVVSGMLFGELSNKSRSFFYLLIPASLTEKFLSKIIIALVFFPILIICLFFVISEVSNVMSLILFESGINSFYLLNDEFLRGVRYFYTFSPLFIFGSVYFNGQGLLKTIVAAGITTIVLYLIFAIEWKLLFWNYSNFLSIKLSREYMFTRDSAREMYPVISFMLNSFRIFVQIVFAPLMLVISYIAIKEREV